MIINSKTNFNRFRSLFKKLYVNNKNCRYTTASYDLDREYMTSRIISSQGEGYRPITLRLWAKL